MSYSGILNGAGEVTISSASTANLFSPVQFLGRGIGTTKSSASDGAGEATISTTGTTTFNPSVAVIFYNPV